MTFSNSVSDNQVYPFVTIGIPTFNRAALLKGRITAALSQTYPHFEVVAVHGDKAWVRNVLNGTDHLALLSRCRKINGQPAEG